MIRIAISVLLAIVIGHLVMTGAHAQEPEIENSERSEKAIPFKTQTDANTPTSARAIWVTLVAIGFALAGALLLRQYLRQKGLMPPVKVDRMIVNGVKRVSPKLTLYLISVDGREYLIAQSGSQTSIIQHDGSAIESVP